MEEARARLARRLRLARESAAVTQARAAEALDLDPTAVAKIESGARQVDAVEIAALARLYRVRLNSLLDMSGEHDFLYLAHESENRQAREVDKLPDVLDVDFRAQVTRTLRAMHDTIGWLLACWSGWIEPDE